MIFGRILFLILTFILSSCSTSLKVNSGVCEGKFFLGNFVESKDFKTKKNFQFEHKILSSFSYRGNAEVIYLDQVLETQTHKNSNFLDLILPQQHILKAQIGNIATPLYIIEHPYFVEC